MLQNRLSPCASVAPGHVFDTLELLEPKGVSPESFEAPDLLASVALQCKGLPGVSFNGREGCHGAHVSEPQQEPFAQAVISSLIFSKLQPTSKNQTRQVGSCWGYTEEMRGAWSAEPELQYFGVPGWLAAKER
jgi:hypothetical protein